jgi:hypothetical protein
VVVDMEVVDTMEAMGDTVVAMDMLAVELKMDLATQSLFKDLLQKRLQDLYLEAEKIAAGLTDTEAFPDPIDRATADWEKGLMLSIAIREILAAPKTYHIQISRGLCSRKSVLFRMPGMT